MNPRMLSLSGYLVPKVFLSLFFFHSFLSAQTTWYPLGGEISSVRYDTITSNGSEFLAAGDGRRYSVSNDGINWETGIIEVPELQRVQITRVASSPTGWHALFRMINGGNFLFAENPADWKIPDTLISPSYIDAAHGNNVQVALRSNRRSVLKSQDGSDRGFFIDVNGRYDSIAFGEGLFVMCGDGGAILTSSNGSSWTSRISRTSSNLNRIKYSQGEFYCVGDDGLLLRSDDGLTWAKVHAGGDRDFSDVALLKGKYYVMAYHPDPISRIDRAGNVEHLGLIGIEASGIAANENRIVICGNRGLLAHSTNGDKWFNTHTLIGSELNAYAFVPGKGVVTRHPLRGLEYSKDLNTWYASFDEEEYSVPFSYNNDFYRLNLIDSTFYKSVDGSNWIPASDIPGPVNNMNRFVSANGLLFAFDNDLLAGVLDQSQQWQSPGGFIVGNPSGLRFEGGKYILPTDMFSADLQSSGGLVWTTRSPPGSAAFDSSYVRFRNAFYSVDNMGVIRSVDGTNWEPIEAELFSQYPNSYRDFFLVDDVLYLVNSDGHIFSSSDGLNWDGQRVVNESSVWIDQIQGFEGRVLAIAINGQIYTSEQSIVSTADIEFHKDSDYEYTFVSQVSDSDNFIAARESSEDLVNWHTEFTASESGSPTVSHSIDVRLAGSEKSKFYRAIIVDRSKLGGLWTGVLETELHENSNCVIQVEESARVGFWLKQFEDNRITLDRVIEGGTPLFNEFEGTVDLDSMQFDLTRNIDSTCIDSVDCVVGLHGVSGSGLSLVIQWIESVCGAPNCNHLKTLRLYQ